MKTIKIGGPTAERLFLLGDEFVSKINNTKVIIVPTNNYALYSPMDKTIARHKGRYSLAGLFVRPGDKILDFPCGSGYGINVLNNISDNLDYEGRDLCPYTIEYNKRLYLPGPYKFFIDNMRFPKPTKIKYNVIACLEGLEHIEAKYQLNLIKYFYNHLAENGVLIISSPETISQKSGPNKKNKFHVCELTKKDFYNLLYSVFSVCKVEVVSFKEKLSDNQIHNCFYGICHK